MFQLGKGSFAKDLWMVLHQRFVDGPSPKIGEGSFTKDWLKILRQPFGHTKSENELLEKDEIFIW